MSDASTDISVMKKLLVLLAYTLLSSAGLFAQKQKNRIQASIIYFFDGFSEINIGKVKQYSTDDLLLLENGVIWNLDTLAKRFNLRKNSTVQRMNKFQFITTEQQRRTAWVSYYNTAELKDQGKMQTIKWLESAVLFKKNGMWKIKLLHSTKLK